LDIDLLKLEYPGSPQACRRLSEILDRPWAVLSAGVPFDQFTGVIQIATDEGGASGFIAGRSVWREVVSLTGQQRQEFLTSVALPRVPDQGGGGVYQPDGGKSLSPGRESVPPARLARGRRKPGKRGGRAHGLDDADPEVGVVGSLLAAGATLTSKVGDLPTAGTSPAAYRR
jgi:hypothetical protein